MKVKKLIPMVQFILEIDWMTTKEFCETYQIPLPTVTGGVNDFLQVDAIKHKMFVEYAKFLNKPLEMGMFYPLNEKGEIMFYDAINFENANKFKDAERKLLFNGFSLKGSYQSSMMTIHFQDVLNIWWWDRTTQVWSISKGLKTIGDLVNYGLSYNDR